MGWEREMGRVFSDLRPLLVSFAIDALFRGLFSTRRWVVNWVTQSTLYYSVLTLYLTLRVFFFSFFLPLSFPFLFRFLGFGLRRGRSSVRQAAEMGLPRRLGSSKCERAVKWAVLRSSAERDLQRRSNDCLLPCTIPLD